MNDELQSALRDALNHLYDPDRLRQSPLIQDLGFTAASQPAARLQQLLLDAIRAMQPSPGEPAASVRRRVFSILKLRYEQQFSQKEVATQLGLSVRQYRRLQQAALQALALHVSPQLKDARPVHTPQAATETATQPAVPAVDLPETLQWIGKLAQDETARVDLVLEEVARLIGPLAQRHGKTVLLAETPPVNAAVHPMVLRQALLNVLNAAILHGASQQLTVYVHTAPRLVTIAVASAGTRQSAAPAVPVVLAKLAMAQAMIQAFGGELVATADTPAGSFYAELRCRSTGVTPVLVVDDHKDTLDLLQRYVAGTPYTLVTVNDPQQAVEQAAAHQPCAVLLDVMMPELDGWDVLTRLKQDERTAHLPVLVCTVLDQSELALSLGASGFLRKPVTRQALLAALNDLAALPAPAPG